MNVFCLGLSHHTADIAARERFAGHGRTVPILREAGCAEALLLTTCNRIELYGASERLLETSQVAAALQNNGTPITLADAEAFYHYQGLGCAEHLFRVASGLDSMVLGETEIFGQAKRAYDQARESGNAGPYLHRLFQRAFRVAKQVRTNTEITRRPVSVGSVAVDLAEKLFGDLRGRKVLVLGAGENSEKTLRALAARGVSDLRVSNRTPARAEEIAAHLEGIAVPFTNWIEQGREIDILISSTAAQMHLLTAESLAPIIRERVQRPLFIIDIAVPRDIAPEVNDLEGVYLYDIDSLQSIAEQSRAARRQQISAAEAIITEHVADFGRQIGAIAGGESRNWSFPGRLRTSEL
jgi:glutamyl-tRNA reductase